MKDERIEAEVWDTVQRLNRAWTVERAPERLEQFFHRDMVAITATEPGRLVGRAACLASWKGFADAARIERWTELDPKVQLHAGGLAAVVSYDFEIAFEMGGRRLELPGRDLFVLAKEEGRWWAVADHFSPRPPASPPA